MTLCSGACLIILSLFKFSLCSWSGLVNGYVDAYVLCYMSSLCYIAFSSSSSSSPHNPVTDITVMCTPKWSIDSLYDAFMVIVLALLEIINHQSFCSIETRSLDILLRNKKTKCLWNKMFIFEF